MSRKRLSAKVNSLNLVAANMKQAVFFYMANAISPGLTKFISPAQVETSGSGILDLDPTNAGNANQNFAMVIPFACTIKNLYFWMAADLGSTGFLTMEFVKNGVVQAIQALGGATSTGNPTLVSDTTHSFACVAGDLISIKIINAAGSDNPILGGGVFELDAS